MAEHGIDFGDAFEPQAQGAHGNTERGRGFLDFLISAGQEFMQRRIKQAHGDGKPLHGREQC